MKFSMCGSQVKDCRCLTAGPWLALSLALLALPWQARAQTLYGSLTGNVTDQSGAAVPGAKVEVNNVATGVAAQASTNDRGIYLLTNLQPGTYKVTISAPAFATVVHDGVPLEANMVRRLDIQLEVAQARQTITVEASAAALQTDRADVNTQIRSSQIANLPLGADRNFQALFKIVPGSTPPAMSHSAAGNPTGAMATSVNGAPDTSNMTRIDGTADPNFWELNIIAYVPPAEAIEAVNIVTGNFDAEQGSAAGSVVTVSVKSGTNEFHGAGWEYNTVSALKARNFFYAGSTNPKNILNQFGLALGGPIKKNKLFFYIDWERYLLRQAVSGYQTIPTDALKQGIFTSTNTTIYDPSTGNPNGTGRTPFPNGVIPADRLSAPAVKMAALFPAVNMRGGISNNYFAVANYIQNRDSADLKINYNPSDKATVFGRYSAEPTYVFDPPALATAGGNALGGGQPGGAPGLTQSAALGATYTFTPQLLLDANVGYTRQHLDATNIDLGKNYGSDVLGIPGTNGPAYLQGGYPNFGVSGFSSFGNPNVSNPFSFRDNEYLYAANLSWMKGSHSIRLGTDMGDYQINHFQAQLKYGVRGGFSFTGGLTALSGSTAPNLYNAWADFMLGLPQAMGKDYQYINPATVRETTYAFYIRDRWQVTRKLTLSYGLRWERYPFATRDHFGGARYDPYTNTAYLGGVNGVPEDTGMNVGIGMFVPRLGIAYRLNDKTVIRTGFGLSVDNNYFTYMRDAYPAVISQQFSGANSYTAAGNLTTGLPGLVGPDLTQGKWQLPTNVGTNTYPAPFRRGYVESFNFTVQRDLGKSTDLQAGYVGSHPVRAVNYLNLNADAPGGGNANLPLYKLWGNANTINLIMPFNGGSYNSLQTQLTRRLAGGSNVGVLYTYSKAMDYADTSNGSLMWNWTPVWDRNKALAGYDRTHNVQLHGTYSFPFGRGQRWVTSGIGGAILGGWTMNGILSRDSGTPFSISSSGASLNAPGNSQTADQVVSSVAILGGHGPNAPYFDPSAFAPVTAVRFGSSGRDILRGPGLFNVDASLFREFVIREKIKAQFRAEAYSLTNTPQFGNPATTVSNATFSNGVIGNLNGYDIISSAGGARQLRFGLKIFF